MKRAIKYSLMVASVFVLSITSFIAGAYYRPKIWIDPPAFRATSTMILSCPPSEVPLYTTDDFSRANQVVRDFLSLKAEDSQYQHLDLNYFGMPDDMGYTTYTYSALKFKTAGRPFPEKLKAELDEVFSKALNQTETEQATPSNR